MKLRGSVGRADRQMMRQLPLFLLRRNVLMQINSEEFITAIPNQEFQERGRRHRQVCKHPPQRIRTMAASQRGCMLTITA